MLEPFQDQNPHFFGKKSVTVCKKGLFLTLFHTVTLSLKEKTKNKNKKNFTLLNNKCNKCTQIKTKKKSNCRLQGLQNLALQQRYSPC